MFEEIDTGLGLTTLLITGVGALVLVAKNITKALQTTRIDIIVINQM